MDPTEGQDAGPVGSRDGAQRNDWALVVRQWGMDHKDINPPLSRSQEVQIGSP
jgi:hypothetical protein